jgi:hypothetical protein
MQDELRKLAAAVREEKVKAQERKFIKCAQVIRGFVGLGILKRKLGRTS